MPTLENLKYPIGRFIPPPIITPSQLQQWITDLATFPQQLIEITTTLTETQLELCYRKDGWNIRQVIHHLADSHINAYTRFHLTLTEDRPIIRPYFEDRWAELPDGKTGDIQLSINMLTSIHQRLVFLLGKLNPIDFERTYIHPDANQEFTMGYLTGNYAWHGQHHLAHIKIALGQL
ncbi:MAG: putative metal-dependent hydrolase [Pedobacter sp.]|nr:putative metal-dependent hydrolase [Pedobacter sp.]MDQ8052484.1 putative metal-dependent hydrolase [Pedobacter sp.]